MIPRDEIKNGTIVEVMSGRSVYLSADPNIPLDLEAGAGPHRFAVPLNYLAILDEPENGSVKVAWGSEVLWASYRAIRYNTENISTR